MRKTAGMAGDNGEEERKIKVTAVGDCGVGKTCLLMTYATNKFPDSEVPGLYECSQTVKGRRLVLLCVLSLIRTFNTVTSTV